MAGGRAADILMGHGGADTLIGNDGNDILFGERPAVSNARLAPVRDFAVIYQGASYTQAGSSASDHDLLIINPARAIPGTVPADEQLWTTGEIAAIRSSGTGKLAIGYIDIAAVSDYMTQWSGSWTSNGRSSGTNTPGVAPAFLTNVAINGNTRLADFTKTSWETFLKGRIDTLINQGFDGVFLDDVRIYFSHYTQLGISLATAARGMRDLIITISDYARARSPSFIIMENGAPTSSRIPPTTVRPRIRRRPPDIMPRSTKLSPKAISHKMISTRSARRSRITERAASPCSPPTSRLPPMPPSSISRRPISPDSCRSWSPETSSTK